MNQDSPEFQQQQKEVEDLLKGKPAADREPADPVENPPVENPAADNPEDREDPSFDSPPPRQSVTDGVRLFCGHVAEIIRTRSERKALSDVATQKSERRSQQRNLLLSLLGIGAVAVLFVWIGDKIKADKTKIPPAAVYKSDYRLAPDNLEKQSFQRRYDEKLDDLTARLNSAESVIGKLEEKLRAARARSDPASQGQTARSAEPPVNAARLASAEDAALLVQGARSAQKRERIGMMEVGSAPAAVREDAESPTRRFAQSVRTTALDTPIAQNRARHEKAGTYLPAGSFVKASVLSGVTAPTGGNAAQNPVPMLLTLTDLAQLPNDFRSNVKSCFITANATGDLSSERVWVRLDRLSCLTHQGSAVDVRVQGYVTGDDGKTGVRARLVTRSGQAIANALFLGSLSGLGKAVSLSAQSSTTYSSGSVSSNVDNPWRAGMGSGLSDAMDRIVSYYLKLADKIFPVLEIDSGRRVEVVFSQGVSINPEKGTPAGDRDAAPAPETVPVAAAPLAAAKGTESAGGYLGAAD